MHAKKKAAGLFWISVACLFVNACSFAVMPFARDKMLAGDDGNLFLICGLMFWIPLVLGYLLLAFANAVRRRAQSAKMGKKRYGFLHPFSTLPGVAADAVFLVGVFVTAILLIKGTTSYLVYIFLTVTVFSFHLHGILNGVNFIYITDQEK